MAAFHAEQPVPEARCEESATGAGPVDVGRQEHGPELASEVEYGNPQVKRRSRVPDLRSVLVMIAPLQRTTSGRIETP